MAITRTTINSDFAAMKAALETLVPDFFAAVEISGDGLTISCEDADENIIFKIVRTSNNAVWNYNAFRTDTDFLGTGTGNYSSPIDYFYKVGSNGAIFHKSNGGSIIVAKDTAGNTAFAVPSVNQSGASAAKNAASFYPVCWGDDTAFNAPLQITDSTNPTTGNHTLFVPIPLYGSYENQNFMQKAYFIPIAQPAQRGAFQELEDSTNGERYALDGYVALLDG